MRCSPSAACLSTAPYSDDWRIEVRANQPSPAMGETATQVTTSLFREMAARRSRQSNNAATPVSGIGDEAYVRQDTRIHRIGLVARRANLIILVAYGNDRASSLKTMQKKATAVAKAVLADYA